MKISSIELCDELLALLGRFKSTMGEVAESHGLTPIQLGALYQINHGFTTMGKVAQKLHCDASNVTGIIDRLTILKLVTRQDDPKDRRVKTLALTAKGHTILDEVLALMPSRLGCDRLSADERVEVFQSVKKLSQI